jgi:molecular chaperone DnaK
MSELVVGIDLGTTNSEIAAFTDGQVRVLGPGDTRMLPSCVGFSLSGELLVGEAARNQQTLYPERTVRSIKRKMGSTETVTAGDKTFTPQEVSALILRELAEWARQSLGERPEKAVIRHYRARLFLRRAKERDARGWRSGRTGGRANSERTHGRKPRLRLWRRNTAYGGDL